MQRTIPMFGIDFEVEFDMAGDIDAIYIRDVDVTEVVDDLTKNSLRAIVEQNAKRWFDEYLRDIKAEELAARRAA